MKTDTQNAAATACEALGLTYTAAFVPFSQSRNAKPIKSPSDLSLNWRITLSKGHVSLTTDYSAGIGHIPGYKYQSRLTVAEFDAIKFTCESGKYVAAKLHPAKKIQPPPLADILYSLVQDASVLDSGGFENWASDYGYDTDSRKAEAMYQACLKIALELRALLGADTVANLSIVFADY